MDFRIHSKTSHFPESLTSMPSKAKEQGKAHVTVALKDIRFTQDSIANTFGKHSFESTATDLKEGRLIMGDEEGQLPRINVINLGGFYFSLDNRRLYCLLLAFGDQPNKHVCVWEKPMTRTIEKELVWKFSTGLSLKVRGATQDGKLKTLEWNNMKSGHVDRKRSDPKVKQGEDSASAFLARQLTDQQIEVARDAVREEYESEMKRLKEEAQEKDLLLAGYRDCDEDVSLAILNCLKDVAYLEQHAILHALPKPPSALQLERVLEKLVSDEKIVRKGVDKAAFRFGLPNAPWANSGLETIRFDGLWTITSSAAKRSHPDLDGLSLARKGAYVGCSLSYEFAGKDAGVVLRLAGDWAKDDKLLLGLWPSGTDVDGCFCLPGPDARETGIMKRAPGFWISCSSGYFLRGAHRFSPQSWEPPLKADGVRWGLQISAQGEIQVTCAMPGEVLNWSDRKWNGDPNLSAESAGLVVAVLLQPHNRRGSKAQVVIEKLGHLA